MQILWKVCVSVWGFFNLARQGRDINPCQIKYIYQVVIQRIVIYPRAPAYKNLVKVS